MQCYATLALIRRAAGLSQAKHNPSTLSSPPVLPALPSLCNPLRATPQPLIDLTLLAPPFPSQHHRGGHAGAAGQPGARGGTVHHHHLPPAGALRKLSAAGRQLDCRWCLLLQRGWHGQLPKFGTACAAGHALPAANRPACLPCSIPLNASQTQPPPPLPQLVGVADKVYGVSHVSASTLAQILAQPSLPFPTRSWWEWRTRCTA